VAQEPEYGTNTPYIIDFIKFTLSPQYVNLDEIRTLLVEKGFSPSQIAEKLMVSKSVIKSRLHEMGLNYSFNIKKNLNPKNYRCPVAPYGYKVHNGQLVPHKKELIMIRVIIKLIRQNNYSHTEAARELEKREFIGRNGKPKWNSKIIYNIYHRWKEKI